MWDAFIILAGIAGVLLLALFFWAICAGMWEDVKDIMKRLDEHAKEKRE